MAWRFHFPIRNYDFKLLNTFIMPFPRNGNFFTNAVIQKNYSYIENNTVIHYIRSTHGVNHDRLRACSVRSMATSLTGRSTCGTSVTT